MPRSSNQLRADALAIWQAGLNAVKSDRLMHQHVQLDGRHLIIGASHPERIDLTAVRHVAVVGVGKAGAGMAAALEQILGPELMAEKYLTGWVNVPADCVHPLQHIYLHAARPPMENEPTAEGLAGADEMLRMVSSLGADDLCIALVSGGGTALSPAPIEGVTLADLVAITRHLSASGADIRQLNTVRKQLSRFAGGGVARACRAGRLITLIISDVLGDPLDLIGSGPTVPDTSTPQQALDILTHFDPDNKMIPRNVIATLQTKASSSIPHSSAPIPHSSLCLLANNATAIAAAAQEAQRLGYATTTFAAQQLEGPVEPIGRHLADMAAHLRSTPGPKCFISGGEGTVKLAPENQRGLGGRNQQTILAALIRLQETNPHDIAILSAGTDGEDGPTDAAGALIDSAIIEEAHQRHLNPADHLRRNDAYHFFQPLGALIKTGPTHTNVCDLRLVLTPGA